jgi:threonine dehydrogenase-like Zn-dependent dehydrogenase
MLRPHGTLVLKSTYARAGEINLSSLVVDEITVIGSRCGPFVRALGLLEVGLVDVLPLIQARYPLEEGREAFRQAAGKGTLKVLLDIN